MMRRRPARGLSQVVGYWNLHAIVSVSRPSLPDLARGGAMKRIARWAAVVPCVLVVAGCGSHGSVQGAPAGGADSGGNVASTDTGSAAPVSSTGVGGSVSTPDGAPVAVATVDRKPVGSDIPVTQQVAVTDPEGRYFWPLTPGEWEITISAPGWQSASQHVSVSAGQLAELDFVLQPTSK
jgi:hypothetical protein